MLPPDSISTIVFDFDGVLTDDKVYVDQDGREMVCCSRRDGLGFDILRNTGIKLFILSTETNPVVSARGKKLKVPVLQGSRNKLASLQSLALADQVDLEKTLFVGNDLNDMAAMRACGYSACPADAHVSVREMAAFVLNTRGGEGVTREIIESVLQIDSQLHWKPQ